MRPDGKQWFWPVCLCILLAAVVIKNLTAGYLDNDFYHIASSGRWIAENGMMYQNPVFVLDGYDTIVQQWLYALLLYKAYALGGYTGVWVFTLLQAVLLGILVHCSLVVRKVDARIASVGALLFLVAVPEKNCRPELISLCLLTAQMICTEHYLRFRKAAVLYLLPVFCLLEINLHAAYAFFHFIFLLPYLVPAHRLPILRETGEYFGVHTEKGPGRAVILPLILMIIVLPLNPYGFRAVTLLFHSRGISKLGIWELQTLGITDAGMAAVAIGLLLLALTIRFRKLREASALFFAGLLLLALLARKNVLMFAPALLCCWGDLFGGWDPDSSLAHIRLQKRRHRIPVVGAVIAAAVFILLWNGVLRIRYRDGGLGVSNGLLPQQEDSESYPENAIRYILAKEPDPAQVKVMTGFNNGAAFVWNGIGHIYIEPKTEPYLQGINHREDVVSEYYYMTAFASAEDFREFLSRYDFDYICCSASMDGLRVYLEETGTYRKAAESGRTFSGYLSGQEKQIPVYCLYEKVR